ncbi:general transcription factor [Lithospermum erythrorhizon]|uniref:General transcription factor n=1 Tax=Lithospermum erythrorhizon TaxID=34254 RepID=A0AAV3Q714_LITER
MGVIKNGSISGTLPNNNGVFAVYYPAYPSSMERAIESLGGVEGISKARSTNSNKLELRFRPEDPYSHPAIGERKNCNKFLLRLSKINKNSVHDVESSGSVLRSSSAVLHTSEQRDHFPDQTEKYFAVTKTNSGSPTEAEADTAEHCEQLICADIISRVPEAYYFNGMVDYQHVLPVHADVARRKKRNWEEVEPQLEKDAFIDVDNENLMILLPQFFSLKDTPEKVVLKPSVDPSSKKKEESVVKDRWEMELEPSLAIDFYIKEIPKKVDWEKYIPLDSEQYEWQKAVSELFEERPIWVKNSLIERLLKKGMSFGIEMLRRLLFRVAYYFANGPFLRFWIRKGYDPRTEPESRIYQRIDFRVPPPLRTYTDATVTSGVKHKWSDICAFKVFPLKFQTSMQLFELEDDYIQQEILKPTNQATCSCATGWFSPNVLNSLRLCVAKRFLSVFPEPGADSLLKSTCRRFEKSKKMRVIAKDLRLDDQEENVTTDYVNTEDKEPNDEEEDDNVDDDNIDDGNLAEDMDNIYDAMGMDGDEGNFPQQHDTYPDGQNVSVNHLQDLFGGFLGSSDEEYQVYDQYSDGNGSNEDAL